MVGGERMRQSLCSKIAIFSKVQRWETVTHTYTHTHIVDFGFVMHREEVSKKIAGATLSL